MTSSSEHLDFIRVKFKQHINYQDKYIKERMENVCRFLDDVEHYFINYFDNKFETKITNNDSLSNFNPFCRVLLKLSDYLLGAIDVIDDNFNLESVFNKRLLKETPLSSLSNNNDENETPEYQDAFLNIMKLKNKTLNKNYKNLRYEFNHHILNKDMQNVVDQYNIAIDDITNKIKNHSNIDISRYTLTKMKNELLRDVKEVYNSSTKKIDINVDNIKNFYSFFNSESFDLSKMFDCESTKVTFKDIKSLRYVCMLNANNIEIVNLKEDIRKILNCINLKPSQFFIIECLEKGENYSTIAKKYNLSKSYISKNVHLIITKIKKNINLNKRKAQIYE